MPFSVTVGVDPTAVLPTDAKVRLIAQTYFGPEDIAVSTPGSFVTWYYAGTRALPASFSLTIEVTAGPGKPVRLTAIIPDNTARIAFYVLPGTGEQKRFMFVGNILHGTNQTVCQVQCLNDGATAGPGQCVECANDDAIVRLCC